MTSKGNHSKDWNIKNNPSNMESFGHIESINNLTGMGANPNDNKHDSSSLPPPGSKDSRPDGESGSDSKPKLKRSVRAKYSRPCDGCALRKVRCDQKKPCSRCVEHNIPCTENRLRKKCGPKHIHKKTRDSINNLSMGNAKINTLGDHNEILTLDKLLPCLQIYQTWYYGI